MKTFSTEEIKILNLLDENANISTDKIANQLNLSVSEVEKIKINLEESGIILKYKAIINWEKIETPAVVALIEVSVTTAKGFGYDEVAKVISSFPEVKTCLLVSGSFDLLVEVEGPSLRDVAFFVADKLSTIDGVNHTKTNFLLRRYKQDGDMLVSGKTHRLSAFI